MMANRKAATMEKVPQEGSRKRSVYDVFTTKGPDDAMALGISLELKPGTMSSWFGVWRRMLGMPAPAKPERPASASTKGKAAKPAAAAAGTEPSAPKPFIPALTPKAPPAGALANGHVPFYDYSSEARAWQAATGKARMNGHDMRVFSVVGPVNGRWAYIARHLDERIKPEAFAKGDRVACLIGLIRVNGSVRGEKDGKYIVAWDDGSQSNDRSPYYLRRVEAGERKPDPATPKARPDRKAPPTEALLPVKPKAPAKPAKGKGAAPVAAAPKPKAPAKGKAAPAKALIPAPAAKPKAPAAKPKAPAKALATPAKGKAKRKGA